MRPPMMPGMFPPAPMADLFMVQDAQKDIFGKDPVPKNQQLMKKLKDKTDLFEPQWVLKCLFNFERRSWPITDIVYKAKSFGLIWFQIFLAILKFC